MWPQKLSRSIIGFDPHMGMNVKVVKTLMIFPMNFRSFSIEYSLEIQCRSVFLRHNSNKVILTSGGGCFPELWLVGV
jgi:hypothetical protein